MRIACCIASTTALNIFTSLIFPHQTILSAFLFRLSCQLQFRPVPLVRSSLRISKLSWQLHRYVYTVQLSLGQTRQPITQGGGFNCVGLAGTLPPRGQVSPPPPRPPLAMKVFSCRVVYRATAAAYTGSYRRTPPYRWSDRWFSRGRIHCHV